MGVMTTLAGPGPFARELRRWRALRRWSQLDLAIRTGTTQRYLSYLEQGRSQPGRTVVMRLAESLGLALRERNALLMSAGYAPAFDESGWDAPQLEPMRTALKTVLDGHLPYPALIVDKRGILLDANAAFGLFLEDCAPELLRPPVNVHRLALHPNGLARRTANLPEWGRHITEALRTRARLSPDPELDALVTELESSSAGRSGPGLPRVRRPVATAHRRRRAAPDHHADVGGHRHQRCPGGAASGGVPARRPGDRRDSPDPLVLSTR